jgi:hypothetical protein
MAGINTSLSVPRFDSSATLVRRYCKACASTPVKLLLSVLLSFFFLKRKRYFGVMPLRRLQLWIECFVTLRHRTGWLKQ